MSIIRKERGFSLYDGDGHDQYKIGISISLLFHCSTISRLFYLLRWSVSTELPLKKKVKKNNPGTEADPSSERSSFVAHVTASNLRTDALVIILFSLLYSFNN